jgi:putative transposase
LPGDTTFFWSPLNLSVGYSHTIANDLYASTSPSNKYLTVPDRRFSRALARKKLGSRNRAKAKTKPARLHLRISNTRSDALHKLTTNLIRHRTIVIEDLNVAGMLAHRRLSRAIADVGFYEFRRQLEYKAAMYGSDVVAADRWFPSSKICSTCGAKNLTHTLAERVWTCRSCGVFHDRDANAATNLARYAESSPASACGASGSGGKSDLTAKLPA